MQNWTAEPPEKHEASMRKYEDIPMKGKLANQWKWIKTTGYLFWWIVVMVVLCWSFLAALGLWVEFLGGLYGR